MALWTSILNPLLLIAALLWLLATGYLWKGKAKRFDLNPNKPLHKHWLFWWVAVSPPLIGAGISLSVMHTYNPCWTAECLNTWVESNKLPIGIMALGIPFGVMVGSFHRTLQTAEQIAQTKSNNNFRNGFDHRKLFTEKCEQKLSATCSEKAHLWHDFMFPDAAKSGILSISLKNKCFVGFDFSKSFFGIEFNYSELSEERAVIQIANRALQYESKDERAVIKMANQALQYESKYAIYWAGFKHSFIVFSQEYSFLFDSFEHRMMADKLNEFCSFYEIACELNFSGTQSVDPWFSSLHGSRFISVKKENGFTSEMLDELFSDYGYLSSENKELIRSDFESNGKLRSFHSSGLYLVSKQLHDKLKEMTQNTPA